MSFIHHYTLLSGVVEKGKRRGRLLGFPTLNIPVNQALRFGVYAGYAYIVAPNSSRARCYRGVVNVGVTPMFRRQKPVLEMYLFDYKGSLYGQNVVIALVQYLRPECIFPSVHALIQHIRFDCRLARVILNKRPPLPSSMVLSYE